MNTAPDPDSSPPPDGSALPPFDPRGVIHCSSLRAQRVAAGQPVAILCHVGQVHLTESIDGSSHNALTLRDQYEYESFDTLPVASIALVEQAGGALRSGQRVIAYGVFVESGRRRPGQTGRPNRFLLQSLHPMPRPSCLLAPELDELAQARSLYEELRQLPDGIYQHIRAEALAIMNVVPVWDARFEDCFRLVVMQALSQGMVRKGVNPRLSLALFSEPAKGKSLFSGLAELLAPMAEQVQPNNMSPVGLSATVGQHKGQGWVATPGALPKCDGGTCILDDVHKIEKRDLPKVQGVLLSALEEGKVCAIKAASAKFTASTAVLINNNLRSTNQGKPVPVGIAARLEDLCLSLDLATRLDCPVMVDCVSDPAAVARQVAMADLVVCEAPDQDEQRRRRLKLLIAVIRDEHPEISLVPVSDQMGAMVDDLVRVVRGSTARLVGPDQVEINGDMFLLRSANTLRKLVGASARLCGREVASEEDLGWAWRMLSFKLELIKWLCSDAPFARPLLARAAAVERMEDEALARFESLQDLYGGKEAESIYVLAYQLNCGVRLLRRELLERGIEPVAGKYAIPTPEQYEAIRQRQKAQKEAYAQAGLVPPVTLSDQLEPEAPVPTRDGGVRFKDCIAPVPAALEEAVKWIKRIDDDQVLNDLGDAILSVALEERQPILDGALLIGQSQALADQGYDDGLFSVPWRDMVYWLRDGDWVTRGKAAISLYIAAELPDRDWIIEEGLRKHGDKIPQEIQQGLRAVLQRLKVRLLLQKQRMQKREMDALQARIAAGGVGLQE